MKHLIKLSVVTMLLATTVLSSCSKKKDPAPQDNKKTAKFTITVNGSTANSTILFQIDGTILSSTTQPTLWKVNGVAQNNQPKLKLEGPSFAGATKTYVVESIIPVDILAAAITCIGRPGEVVSISFKADVNNKTETNIANESVAEGQSYNKTFLY